MTTASASRKKSSSCRSERPSASKPRARQSLAATAAVARKAAGKTGKVCVHRNDENSVFFH